MSCSGGAVRHEGPHPRWSCRGGAGCRRPATDPPRSDCSWRARSTPSASSRPGRLRVPDERPSSSARPAGSGWVVQRAPACSARMKTRLSSRNKKKKASKQERKKRRREIEEESNQGPSAHMTHSLSSFSFFIHSFILSLSLSFFFFFPFPIILSY